MNNKRGSSAVFLMVILASLISITLALIYGVKSECVRSRADGIINLAADSVMSEFNYDIQKEYGLFVIKGKDNDLTKKLCSYVNYSINDMKNVTLESAQVSGSRFSTSNIDLIKDQILEYMKLSGAEDGFNMWKGDTEKENSESITENRTLKHGPTAVSLPSAAMPDKNLTSVAQSIADNVKDADKAFKAGTEKYIVNEYIFRNFSNKNKSGYIGHFFKNEAEYILGGELSDRKNEKRVEIALKAMRFPLNLAYIYSDSVKRAETLALAETITPGAAAPATQAALAATWAYAEADNDINLLWLGHKVPMTKDKTSWAINLENAVEGLTGGPVIPTEEKGYDYEQYLHMLMFFQDDNVKISRILDLIQINMRMSYDRDFLMSEHSVGISVQVKINGRDYSYEKNIKGFYTLEAALCLPLVILAVLSLGYFMKIEGMWENCMYGAIDESSVIASKAYNGIEAVQTATKVKHRITEDNPELDSVHIKNVRIRYSDIHNDNLNSYEIQADKLLSFPLAFEKEFSFKCKIKFRGFVGKKESRDPLGVSGLQQEERGQPVWIFPQSGNKYHTENCTYVKATVHPVILTDNIKKRYSSCGLCKSENSSIGSIVFCFESLDTSYHIGTCRSIKRRSAVIDKTEAIKQGYTPCMKCGGE